MATDPTPQREDDLKAARVDTLAVVWQKMVATYGAVGAPDVAMIKAARRLGVGDEFHALLARGVGS